MVFFGPICKKTNLWRKPILTGIIGSGPEHGYELGPLPIQTLAETYEYHHIMCKCIFCLITDKSKFNTKEHIIPESLGGGDWAILPDGLFCDDCQNKFGSNIEQQALADYPLITMRTLIGIPTKKRKNPWFKYPEGQLHSESQPGKITYKPNDFFEKSFNLDKKIHTIVPTSTKKPEFLLRTLLKIGIETIAANDKKIVFEKRFDAARCYALTGKKDSPWFYGQRKNKNLMNQYISNKDWDDHHIFAAVHYDDNGLVYLHMRIYYIEFLVSLLPNVKPDANDVLDAETIVIQT